MSTKRVSFTLKQAEELLDLYNGLLDAWIAKQASEELNGKAELEADPVLRDSYRRACSMRRLIEGKLRDAIGIVKEEPKPKKQYRPKNDGLDSLRELLSW